MQYREWRYRTEKSEWESGPWQNEPDKIQWEDEATRLPCLIVRGPSGALCGYVGVTEGHPFFGKNYNDVEIEVHGGLTFSDYCRPSEKEGGICHIPDQGEPDRVYWFGFDCAHLYDKMPAYSKHGSFSSGDTYRDIDYVKHECAGLAKQLADAKQ